MPSAFSDSLFIPALVLALMAWVVPKLLSMVVAEGVWPLMFIAFCSALFLFGLSSAFFVVLYMQQGLSLKELLEPGLIYNVVFFGRLGLSSTLIWSPIMILSVAGLPRNWTQETW